MKTMTRQQAIEALVRFGMDPVVADLRVSKLIAERAHVQPERKAKPKRRVCAVKVVSIDNNWAAECGREVVYGD